MPRTNVVNAFDDELSAILAVGATDMLVANVAGFPVVPFYVVLDPFEDALREYVLATAINGTADGFTVVRNLAGSVGDVEHPVTSRVRVAIMAQHITDLWDTVEAPVDLDGTYLRLDAANDPAQRHDVMLGGVLSFDDVSYLSTPNTPDLAIDDMTFTLDVSFTDFAASTIQSAMSNGISSSENRSVGQRSAGADAEWSSFNGSTFSPFAAPLVENQRYLLRYEIEGVDTRVFVDGVLSTSAALNAPIGVVTGDVRVGNGAAFSGVNRFVGDIWSCEVGPFGAPPVATFNAVDLIGQIPTGPIPDGTTFTSGGRVWTVVGAGITFAEIASPVATLDDINAFPVQEAPLDSLQYLRQDGVWVPFAAASITDLNTLDTRLDVVDTSFHQLLTALTARVQALEAP